MIVKDLVSSFLNCTHTTMNNNGGACICMQASYATVYDVIITVDIMLTSSVNTMESWNYHDKHLQAIREGCKLVSFCCKLLTLA